MQSVYELPAVGAYKQRERKEKIEKEIAAAKQARDAPAKPPAETTPPPATSPHLASSVQAREAAATAEAQP